MFAVMLRSKVTLKHDDHKPGIRTAELLGHETNAMGKVKFSEHELVLSWPLHVSKSRNKRA